jgi:hypothetical protein
LQPSKNNNFDNRVELLLFDPNATFATLTAEMAHDDHSLIGESFSTNEALRLFHIVTITSRG